MYESTVRKNRWLTLERAPEETTAFLVSRSWLTSQGSQATGCQHGRRGPQPHPSWQLPGKVGNNEDHSGHNQRDRLQTQTVYQHIEAETKWPALRNFKCIFLNENIWISIEMSLKFVPKDQINNIPAMVQIMAWRRTGDKPLSEPMMVRLLTYIYVTRP